MSINQHKFFPEIGKHIEIEGRAFSICKFNAIVSIKVSKLLIAKILPVLDTFLPSLGGAGTIEENINDSEWLNKTLGSFSMEKIATAIDLVGDDDLDKLIDCSLNHCFEKLKVGYVQVLRRDGTYGTPGIEDDMLFTIRLLIEAIAWGVSGFFDGSRWASVLKPVVDSFLPSASTLMNSFSSPSQQDSGGSMSFGMAHTT